MSLRVNLGRAFQHAYVNMTGQFQEKRKAALTTFMLAVENATNSVVCYNDWTGSRVKKSTGDAVQKTGNSDGSLYAGTQDDYTSDLSAYMGVMQLDTTAIPQYDFKLHADAVANQHDAFSGYDSVRIYTASGVYTTKTLADFFELYDNYLIFDYRKFNKIIDGNYPGYGDIGAYLNDEIAVDAKTIGIKFVYNDNIINVPFCYKNQGSISGSGYYVGSKGYVMGAGYMYNIQLSLTNSNAVNPNIYSTGGPINLLNIYAAEIQNAEGASIDYDDNDLYLLRGNKIISCTNSVGNKPFLIISKDVYDAFILDFYAETGIMLEYSGNIPAPTPTPTGPRITSLTFSDPNAILYPAFDPDFGGPYSLTTKENSITYVWTKNSAVEKVFINLMEIDVDQFTFNLGQGSNQGNITVQGEYPDDYFDYEIQINQYSESDLMPKMTSMSIKDYLTTGNYEITPLFEKNQYDYQCNISPETEAIMFKGLFEHYNKVKINDVEISTGGLGTKIPVSENGTPLISRLTIEVINDSTDPELVTTYRVNLVRQFNLTVPYGSNVTLPGGVQSGSANVINFVTNYNPGFYGGSYVPNYRYVRPIYTTANGENDFEHGYLSRSGGNEDAVAYLNDIINTFTMYGQLDAICEAFIHYSNFINDNSGNNDWRYVLPAINVAILRPVTLTKDNIIPKNNKCYIYPFCELELNGYGTASKLPYEEFQHTFSGGKHVLEFDILCKWFAGTSIQLVPVNFQQIEDNFDYSVAGPEMPVFPYTKDQYLNEYNASRNTRAQALEAARESSALDKKMTIFNGIAGVGQGLVGAGFAAAADSLVGAAGGLVNAGAMAVNTIYGVKKINLQLNQQKAALAAELQDMANRAAIVTNQNASPSITMVMKDAACPFIIHKAIRPEFMRKVDKFFTRFGYRTNRTGIPNIYKRENFCYLECKNAVIGGNIPTEDKQALKAIMEHGITFWHYGSTNFAGVGNYQDSDLTYNAAPYK